MKARSWLTSKVLYWSLFDFANSSFATIVAAFVFAIYFKKTVAGNTPSADLWWSIGINISMLTVALLSPVLGAASDHYHNKKKYLLIFTLICAASTALLYTVKEGMVLWGLFLFIISNIGFQAGLGFYDAFLKEIAIPVNYNKVSSFGYAIGYLGSLFALAVIILFRDEPLLTFPACSLTFLLFSLPLFLGIKEEKILVREKINALTAGFKRIKDTFSHVRQYRQVKNYLIAYFLFIDGVNTVIFFSANFAQTTLGFTINDLILFFIIVQITALTGSFLLGFIADKTTTKGALSFSIIAWAFIVVSIYFVNSKNMFLIIGGLAGTFLGSTQALSRSMFGSLIPDEKKAEFFGFYSLFEKTSTILGPLTFGLVSYLTSDQRIAALSLALFFISGYIMLRKVKTGKAGEEDLVTD